jgi:hypothetical protein
MGKQRTVLELFVTALSQRKRTRELDERRGEEASQPTSLSQQRPSHLKRQRRGYRRVERGMSHTSSAISQVQPPLPTLILNRMSSHQISPKYGGTHPPLKVMRYSGILGTEATDIPTRRAFGWGQGEAKAQGHASASMRAAWNTAILTPEAGT